MVELGRVLALVLESAVVEVQWLERLQVPVLELEQLLERE